MALERGKNAVVFRGRNVQLPHHRNTGVALAPTHLVPAEAYLDKPLDECSKMEVLQWSCVRTARVANADNTSNAHVVMTLIVVSILKRLLFLSLTPSLALLKIEK